MHRQEIGSVAQFVDQFKFGLNQSPDLVGNAVGIAFMRAFPCQAGQAFLRAFARSVIFIGIFIA